MTTKGIASHRIRKPVIQPTKVYQQYDRAKSIWMMEHPHATVGEYEAFIKDLLKRLGL